MTAVAPSVTETEVAAAAVAAGYSEKVAAGLFEPDFCGRLGFPSYELTNNGANIRRIKGRIDELRAAAASAVTQERKVGDVTIREDGKTVPGTIVARTLRCFTCEKECLQKLVDGAYVCPHCGSITVVERVRKGAERHQP